MGVGCTEVGSYIAHVAVVELVVRIVVDILVVDILVVVDIVVVAVVGSIAVVGFGSLGDMLADLEGLAEVVVDKKEVELVCHMDYNHWRCCQESADN